MACRRFKHPTEKANFDPILTMATIMGLSDSESEPSGILGVGL